MFRLAVSAPACEKQRALKGARPAVIVEGPITAAVHSRPQLETENLSLPLENSPCERPVHAYLSALFAAPTCYCTCILHPCPSPLPTIQRTFLPPRATQPNVADTFAFVSRLAAPEFPFKPQLSYCAGTKDTHIPWLYLASGYATKPLHAGNPSMNRFHLALRPA